METLNVEDVAITAPSLVELDLFVKKVLTKELQPDVPITGEITLGQLGVWRIDLLCINSALNNEYHRSVVSRREFEKIKKNPHLFDEVTVNEFVQHIHLRLLGKVAWTLRPPRYS